MLDIIQELNQSPGKMLTAGVIGVGMAGSRFVEAIQYLQKNAPESIKLSWVCDINAKALQKQADKGIPAYDDYKKALTDAPVDCIFACVNDVYHFDILQYIKDSNIPFRRIISEKPLTDTAERSQIVASRYNNQDISLNYVMRYSPIVADFLKFKHQHGLQITRAEYQWWKDRVNDPRTTPGVKSEACHPLELIIYMAGLEPTAKNPTPYKVKQVGGIYTDYAIDGDDIMGEVHATLNINNGVTVSGSASFITKDKRRLVTLWATDKRGNKYRANFNFDDPGQDDDSLTITRLGPKRQIVFKNSYHQADLPKGLGGNSRIVRFIG